MIETVERNKLMNTRMMFARVVAEGIGAGRVCLFSAFGRRLSVENVQRGIVSLSKMCYNIA